MAAARLRGLGSRLSSMFSKRSISFYKAKSGLMVPEGYEKTETGSFENIKESIKRNWYRIDESARSTIIQSVTKYTIAAASGGGTLVFLNMTREQLNDLQTSVEADKKEQDATNEMIKSEVEKTKERFHKLQKDYDQKLEKIQTDIWLFTHTSRRFDPNVLSGVRSVNLYDPIQILKSKYNPKQTHMTQEQIVKFQVLFALHNRDGNGILSKELGAVMKSIGKSFSEPELNAMMKEVDGNGSGYIEFHKFLNLMSYQLKKDESKQDLKDAFDMIDKDQDGYILTSELCVLLANCGEKMINQKMEKMLCEANTESEKRLSFDEFKRLMMYK